ncbi:MAG: mannose-1-phosphate guanylyltransferase/phosphomannomutase [Pseudohongiellaceae bacterium]|jgi:mannose-1-phosphate guanylyltransferase/phosphomannomutase
MRALLFANQPGKELAPFTDDSCVTLLPVLGKPIIVHALESLAGVEIEEVLVVISSHAERVEAELGDGTRWGLRLNYITTPNDLPWPDVVSRLGRFLDGQSDFLAVRGDVVRSENSMVEFLSIAGSRPESNIEGVAFKGGAAGLRLVRGAWDDEYTPVLLESTSVVQVVDHASLLSANCRAAAGEIGSKWIGGHAIAEGVRIGSHSEIARDTLRSPPFYADEGVKVRAGAVLEGPVVLGQNVIVDEGAVIHNALVMPNTYVGREVELRNAIAWRKQLIRVDLGTSTRIDDPFLLGDLTDAPALRAISNFTQKAVALTLLAASLPLWPLVAVSSLLCKPGAPFRKVELLGNRRQLVPGSAERRSRQPFRYWKAAVPVPFLSHLGRLIPVIKGDLALVGVRPLSAARTDELQDEWQLSRESAPAGLVGPAHAHGDSEEEKLLIEALFAQGESPWKGFGMLPSSCAALFSAGAWKPEPTLRL